MSRLAKHGLWILWWIGTAHAAITSWHGPVTQIPTWGSAGGGGLPTTKPIPVATAELTGPAAILFPSLFCRPLQTTPPPLSLPEGNVFCVPFAVSDCLAPGAICGPDQLGTAFSLGFNDTDHDVVYNPAIALAGLPDFAWFSGCQAVLANTTVTSPEFLRLFGPDFPFVTPGGSALDYCEEGLQCFTHLAGGLPPTMDLPSDFRGNVEFDYHCCQVFGWVPAAGNVSVSRRTIKTDCVFVPSDTLLARDDCDSGRHVQEICSTESTYGLVAPEFQGYTCNYECNWPCFTPLTVSQISCLGSSNTQVCTPSSHAGQCSVDLTEATSANLAGPCSFGALPVGFRLEETIQVFPNLTEIPGTEEIVRVLCERGDRNCFENLECRCLRESGCPGHEVCHGQGRLYDSARFDQGDQDFGRCVCDAGFTGAYCDQVLGVTDCHLGQARG